MNERFYLEKLVVTGTGVKDAILKFTAGANLITGPSDTGKSYIFQCIDYLLGGENIPKIIPESAGYTDGYLEIKTAAGKPFTINRNLKAISKATVSDTVYERFLTSHKRTLGSRNNTLDGENISEFLLNLMGVSNILLKTNAANKTRKLSYRDIAQLTLVDESRIITEGSPVYLSQNNYLDFTREKSVFRYLLTENTDNNLIEQEEKKVYESRIKGKMELIENLINSKNEAIKLIQSSGDKITAEELNSKISTLLSKLETSSKRIEELSTAREANFELLQKLKSVQLQNTELLKRFYLLSEHYKNDLNRLNFIVEGEFIFKQLLTKECPVCGTNMDEEHLKCLAENKELKEIGESVKIESQKIEIKLKDLTETITAAELEKNETESKIKTLQTKLENINNELKSELLPSQQNFQTQINQLINFNKIEQEILAAQKDISSLSGQKAGLEEELKSKGKSEVAKVDLPYSVLKTFTEHVQEFLKEWKFPNLTSVEYDTTHKVFDLTISGRGRNSHGKGVRALSYTAFVIGLLDYCIQYLRPHPGFVVLDSPLTTYHNNQGRQNEDEINPDMQEAFFNNLAKVESDRQVIILDNKVPSADVIKKINYILFSNTPNSLRKGFFPS